MNRHAYSETLRRATMTRAKNATLHRARIAAADAACRANAITDFRLALLVFAGAFSFFIILGVM